MGPMLAAREFISLIKAHYLKHQSSQKLSIKCTLKGALSATGKGHATDSAIVLGLNNYLPKDLADKDVNALIHSLRRHASIDMDGIGPVMFSAHDNIIFDTGTPLPEHPNGMIFELLNEQGETLISETYFSIGGGFISKAEEIRQLVAPLKMQSMDTIPYPFDSAQSMLDMSRQSGLSIAEMKRRNEIEFISEEKLNEGLDLIWQAMRQCLETGLSTEGILPGGINLARRAKQLHQKFLKQADETDINDWLCAYAMAVNEENADGHMVVTAPTNGAAGVIPAVLFYFTTHMGGAKTQVREFLLTASAIGGLIKHLSSISGAEVGCQGEVGSASSMAAAGLCAVRGGTPQQVEHAAEIALEHHLGMTCDPVLGLVQVPCIERNGFGAIKAYTAASLALHGSGNHFMTLDKCIAAMKQTGEEMSIKFKETALGGLAVTITEC